jgi:glycosyltransferase involved in cell wall biosynthesis
MPGAQRVLMYSEYWSSRGGGEKYLLCIAETLLRAGYEVTFVAQAGAFDRAALSAYFRLDLDRASVHQVAGDLSALRRAAQHLSRQFDICFYMTNYRFFNSHARQTFVVLQIPYGRISPLTIGAALMRGRVKDAAKDCYRAQLLNKLKETQAVIVYSRYVHDTLMNIHGIPSTVLEPPIDDFLTEGTPKERVILSVGRFFRGLYNDKRYDVLIEAFKKLHARLPHTTWMYRLVGSCTDDAASRRYVEELQESVRGLPVYFHINSSYEDLKRQYNEATLFWHAAGFGVDESRHPERAEHFGMSTLEAMSARCVPIVVNRGGQKEIVSHGESGYLWNTIDELVNYSLELIGSPSLLASMQAGARERFSHFERSTFSRKLLNLLE